MFKLQLLIERAQNWQGQGEYHRALGCYQRALNRDSNRWDIWFEMGACFYGLEDYQRALECALKSTVLDPEQELAWYNAAIACLRLDQDEEALIYLEKALELYPDYLMARICRGDLYQYLQDHTNAIYDFTEALKQTVLDPHKQVQCLHSRGKSYCSSHALDFAIMDFSNALKLNPRHWNSLKDRAYAYYLQERHSSALKDLDRCLEIKKDMEIHYLKGAVLLKLKRNNEACQNFMALERKLS
ncbi:MAG: tetratricopeptide repeat protein [Spirochaetaceae bacterium]|nr:tetratricopeptide repeat protein [Spirochaetaceae bacterium]